MPTSGSRFGRYQLRERLGAGGMGEVFRAWDWELERDVAVKFISGPCASDPARLGRFAAEARAASALNHPNILTIHDVGETAGRPYIVMECVEGKTLRRLLQDRPLPPKQALDIAVQISDGLAKAHAAGIVHRDLKPENVMVTPDGLVKIVDFGLAKPSPPPEADASDGSGSTETHLRAGWTATADGAVIGTAGYMSPEQARGEHVDHRSDQFALGAILYEMATGRRAFHGETVMDTLAAIIDREPEPIASLNPSFPAPARWPIERCLAKRPADRYAATEDLAHELRTVRDHLGETTMSQEGLGRAVRRSAWGRRWGLLAGAAALAGLIVGGLFGPAAWRRLWRPPLPAEMRVAVLPVSVSGDEAEFARGLPEYVSARLVDLGRFDRRVSIVPASEVRSAGVTAPSGARRTLGATLVVTIAVSRSAETLLVSVGLAGTGPVRQLDARTMTVPRASVPVEDIVNLVVTLLDLQLARGDKSAWSGGASPVAEARVRYAQGLASTPYQEGQSQLEKYDQARSLEAAIGLFNDAINLDSRYAAAHAALGEARLKLYRLTRNAGDLALAGQSARQALGLDDTRPGAWMTLGMVFAQQGNLDEAQKAFDAAIARNPQGAETYRELGLAYERAGLWEKAETAYRKAIELQPDAWPNHNYLGSFLFKRRRLAEAEAAFTQARALAPDNARIWSNLAGVYLRQERWDEAESALVAASRHGSSGPALSNLGYLQMQAHRQYAEAALTFAQATRVSPRDSRIWMNLASARQFAGQHDGALEAYRHAATLLEEERQIDPANTATLVALATCYAGVGDPVRGRAAIGEALRGAIASDDWTGVVGVFETLGDRNAALRQFDAALKAGATPGEFEQDPTFDSLRKDPRYEAIVKARAPAPESGHR